MECIVYLVAELRKFYNKFQILLAIFDGFDFFPLTIGGILFCRYIVVCIFLITRY